MFTIRSGTEFINDLREIDEKLKNLRLTNIEIDRDAQKITYNFICDVYVSDALREAILQKVEKITLSAFKEVKVSVRKIVSNDQLVNSEIFKFLTDNFPSISLFLKPTDVISVVVGDMVKYTLRLSRDGIEYVNKNGTLKKLNEHLSKSFCSDFVGGTEEKEAEEIISLVSDEVYDDQFKRIAHRTIKVENVEVIDDYDLGDVAGYIEDALSGVVVICGKVVEVVEKQTVNGKPFFIFKIDDTTGRTSGVYFTNKNTVAKIKQIKEGDAIIARCTIGDYKGKPSLTFNKINRCTFPESFEKKEKYKKETPKTYRNVFPSPASTVKASSVFDDLNLPDELTKKTYVVFDLETTGLDLMNNGITEIGAVKLEKGVITEQFTSLIKPDYPITEEITKLTGITAEMVKDAPKISTVIPDFIKFIEGATLVAQNSEFDMKFIKRFASAEEYDINNEVLDTMDMARRYLPQLKQVKLNVLAEHFGIIFHHHRALSDSYATAEVFIELMKIKARKQNG